MKENESKILQGKAIISVKRTQLDAVLQDDMEEQVIQVRKFETEPAQVTVAVGVTKSMGKGTYEFLRLDVGVTIPCYTEEITEVEKQATLWVDNKMTVKLDELKDKQRAI